MKSFPDFRNHVIPSTPIPQHQNDLNARKSGHRLKACSEADLLAAEHHRGTTNTRQQVLRAREDAREGFQRNPMPGNGHAGSKAGSHLSVNSRMSPDHSHRSPTKVRYLLITPFSFHHTKVLEILCLADHAFYGPFCFSMVLTCVVCVRD